ncbi:MAG TPA: hypothetical protein VGO93_22050 [Candidatus Xenobia bacterium]
MLQVRSLSLVPRRPLRLRPSPLLVANLLAPTDRVEAPTGPAFRVQLPNEPGADLRLDSLRRAGDCIPPLLDVERTTRCMTALIADEGWPGLVIWMLQESRPQHRHRWMAAYLQFLVNLERSQSWMAQLNFRPDHLEMQDGRVRLTVAGLTWVIQSQLCLQACPLRHAADMLETLFPTMTPSLARLANEWRTSTRLSLAEALQQWNALPPCPPPRITRAGWLTMSAVLLGVAALPLLFVQPAVPRPPTHLSQPHTKPQHRLPRLMGGAAGARAAIRL